jgi:hypothetical protein
MRKREKTLLFPAATVGKSLPAVMGCWGLGLIYLEKPQRNYPDFYCLS